MHSIIKYSGFILGMLIFVLTAQAAEINFIQGDFEQAKAQAKKERKLIFVDAYAVWCGPCKMMDRNTFSNNNVADFFNSNFINLKMDVEKGVGPAFANEYRINAMPTLIFLDYNGKVVVKKLGYKGPSELMKLARQADSPKNYEGYYQLAVEEGSSDPSILLNYALIQASKGGDYQSFADKYFATQTEKDLLKNPENWGAIQKLTTDINSREFQFLLSKQKKLRKKYEEVDSKIYKVFENTVLNASKTEDRNTFSQAVSMAKSSLKDNDQTANRLKLLYAKETKDWAAFAELASYYFDNYSITSAKELSSSAWLIYKYVDESDKLSNALKWTQQSIALENEYYNNKTMAFLLYKSNKLGDAKKAAYKTRKLAELKGLDMTEMDELLEKIESRR